MTKREEKSLNSTFKFVRMTIKDLDKCIELDKITLKGLWNKVQWENELKDKKRLVIGVYKESNLIGIASGWQVTDELQITIIGVHPDYQRRGIGKALIIERLDLSN